MNVVHTPTAAANSGLVQVIKARQLAWSLVDVPGENPDVDTAADLVSLG